jgi:hypothetical protein
VCDYSRFLRQGFELVHGGEIGGRFGMLLLDKVYGTRYDAVWCDTMNLCTRAYAPYGLCTMAYAPMAYALWLMTLLPLHYALCQSVLPMPITDGHVGCMG